MRNITSIKPSQSFSITLNVTGVLGIVGGIWLIVSPFLLGYESVEEGGGNATLLGIISGIVVIGVMLFAITTEKMSGMRNYRFLVSLIVLMTGLVLMAAPYLFNYAELGRALWNLEITGGLFTIISGFVAQEMFGQKVA